MNDKYDYVSEGFVVPQCEHLGFGVVVRCTQGMDWTVYHVTSGDNHERIFGGTNGLKEARLCAKGIAKQLEFKSRGKLTDVEVF